MALYYDGRQTMHAAEWMTRDEAIILGLSIDSTADDIGRIAVDAQTVATEDGVILHGLLTQLFLWRAQMRREQEREILRQEIAASL